MTRSTIDFGIDLGTTNSAIAVFTGKRSEPTKIVKNTSDGSDADITPSAVYINKKAVLRVGRRAKDRIADEDQDVQTEFKRQMGTDHVYIFKSSGQRRKPEELSAEILKSLRADVEQRTGEIVDAAVITVPAAFELHQCDATGRAAQLAGLKQSPLIQEPVAAALAYGFEVETNNKTYWLVFDFGGGTFDAAIIRADEGTIQVVDHGGDNFLGGSNVDWAIVEKLLAPRAAKEFGLTDFVRGNPKWKVAFLKLKYRAEEAKIDLSRHAKTTLQTCKFRGESDEDVEFECDLNRDEVIGIAEPFVSRAAQIAKDVLQRKALGSSSIEKVILVGGPTLAPYFREILASKLGIALDHSVDPLTVVASGAAIYAGSQQVDAIVRAPAAADEYQLQLAKSFRPVGLDSAPIIGGKVRGNERNDFTGFTLELVNTKTQWRSGKVALKADGAFAVNIHAELGDRNTFSVQLFDSTGRAQRITPDTITYTIGVGGDVEQPVTNSMGLALANNEYDILFEKGRGLPLKVTRDYRTIRTIRQGQTGELLKIPIVEGDHPLADRNRHIDTLTIDAQNIRRDLPAGSEVEVTLRMDESRILTASAYVPLLDEEFSKPIELRHKNPGARFLKEDFEKEIARFREAKRKAGAAAVAADDVGQSPLMREVAEGIAAAAVDPDAAAKCEIDLLKLKREFDKAANAFEWPALKAEAYDWLSYLRKVADQDGSEKQKQQAHEFAAEVDRIVRTQDAERMRKLIENIARLYYQIVMTQPAFWIYQFQRTEKEQAQITDQEKATRLFNQGREYMARDNAAGLENVVRQLWDLLPSSVVEQAERGYGAGLIR